MFFSILEARFFISPISNGIARQVKDFEIDLEVGPGRVYCNNGVRYKAAHGDILIRKPGDICSSVGVQKTYLLTLDFQGHVSDAAYNRNLPGEIHPTYSNMLLDRLPPILHTENTYEYIWIYRNLMNLADYHSQSAKELVCELLYMLNAEICKKSYENSKPRGCMNEIIVSYMKKNFQKNITLDELADLVHLEKSYMIRRFKKAMGTTPINVLKEIRMEKACDLMANTDIKVNAVAEMCGYKTPSFFISEYKKKYGFTPEVHRKILKTEHK